MKHSSFLKPAVLCAIVALCSISAKAAKKAPGDLIDASAFQTEIDGKPVSLYTITNGKITAQITNYGGYIVGIYTPDKDGNYANVVGHNNDIKQYQGFSMNPCGPALGRYANRIANAAFTLDGIQYHVTKNNGQHMLHGGSKGFDHTVWDVVSVKKNKLVLSCTLADGLDGFPGTMTTILTFSITKDNGVSIDYKATTDKATVCSLSHHAYFNLNGTDSDDILNHVITINADKMTESDPTLIPTGKFLPVEGTLYDFRKGVKLGDRQAKMSGGFPRPGQPMPAIPEGMVRNYDQNFCLNHTAASFKANAAGSNGSAVGSNGSAVGSNASAAGSNGSAVGSNASAAGSSQPVVGKVELVATLYSPETGRLMEVLNNHPGLQLYTGNRKAIAMESQMYPDSPNHPEFPSTTLRPGETYRHTVVYRFSVK